MKSQVAPTHSGLALSPATTSQLAPLVQSALHELPHVAAHEAALHARLQLDPSLLQLPTFVHPQLAPEAPPVQLHALPLHAQLSAGHGIGPLPLLHAAEKSVTEVIERTRNQWCMNPPRSHPAAFVPQVVDRV